MANVAMVAKRFARASAPYLLVAVSGVGAGLLARQTVSWVMDDTSVEDQRQALTKANELLACYGSRTGALGKAAIVYQRASIHDLKTLREVMKDKLLKPLLASNAAFVDVSKAKLAVELRLLAGGDHDTYCKLQAVESYQWTTLRPAINRCLGNLVSAYRQDVAPETFEEILDQQRDPQCWEKLNEVAQVGAGWFEVESLQCPRQ